MGDVRQDKGKGWAKQGASRNLGQDEGGEDVAEEVVDEEVDYRRGRQVDVFDIVKRIPIFTGEEDVEDWLFKARIL